MSSRTVIPCMLIRGGTSKGAYFLASDLPSSREERDALLLSIMGSPHPDQIDGLGGGHPLRSKVAIVSRSTEPCVDVDFLFAQVVVDKPLVDTSPNCGNILSGVGPFAIERGLVKAREGYHHRPGQDAQHWYHRRTGGLYPQRDRFLPWRGPH